MIKSSILKLCIIVALMFFVLCSCWSDVGPNNNTKQSPQVEDTVTTGSTPIDATQTIEANNTNATPDSTNSDNTSSDPVNTSEEVKTDGSIQLVMDKTTATKGEIIKVELTVNNIQNLAAYQVNIKYDSSVLQAVNPSTGTPLANDEAPKGGNIIVNSDYGLMPIVKNNIENGILNFGNTYLNYNKYKSDGKPENTGVLAVVGFKVLEEKSTTVFFEDTTLMPGSISGTQLFDWDGTVLTNYTVVQPDMIN